MARSPVLAEAQAVLRRQLEADAQLKADAEAELARLTGLKNHLESQGGDLRRRDFASHAIYEMLSSVLN